MTLVVLSFFILAYIIASLIIPLPCRPAIKAALSVALLVISQKFLIYRHVGGLLFAPDLPRGLLLVMETLYSAMLFLFILLLIKDALTFLLWLSRLMGTSWHLPFPAAARIIFGRSKSQIP